MLIKHTQNDHLQSLFIYLFIFLFAFIAFRFKKDIINFFIVWVQLLITIFFLL